MGLLGMQFHLFENECKWTENGGKNLQVVGVIALWRGGGNDWKNSCAFKNMFWKDVSELKPGFPEANLFFMKYLLLPNPNPVF